MGNQITISTKRKEKGDLGHKIISVRIKEVLLDQIDSIAVKTNRSRNEIINLLLNEAVEIVCIEE
ncbi:MAG: ribbon-helix-helix protein, CopG family [Mogibacterium sp.]|nr:ribbon-helix-helix protein, CopG family [Mogibacterium sp.]